MNAQSTIKRPRARYATKAVIARMVKAGTEIGLDVVGFEALPDGTIRVIDRSAVPAPPPADEFEAWDQQGKL